MEFLNLSLGLWYFFTLTITIFLQSLQKCKKDSIFFWMENILHLLEFYWRKSLLNNLVWKSLGHACFLYMLCLHYVNDMTGKIHSSHSEFMTGILHRPHELTRPLCECEVLPWWVICAIWLLLLVRILWWGAHIPPFTYHDSTTEAYTHEWFSGVMCVIICVRIKKVMKGSSLNQEVDTACLSQSKDTLI